MELEKQVLHKINEAVGECVTKTLTAYDSPLSKLCKDVINRHLPELDAMVDNAISALVGGDSFKIAIKSALEAKLARTLIERMGGELESQVNKLKSNPETRAKITLAISSVIKDLNN